MELNKNIFREYDIRGKYPGDVNEKLAYNIGLAFGTKLKRLGINKTLVGHDNRLSSPSLSMEIIKGITKTGVNVIDLGLVTTPMYYYGWDLLNVHSGIMITASHNPKDENGFKFSYNGIHNAFGSDVLELYNIISQKDYIISTRGGNVASINIYNKYVEMILDSIDLGGKRIKVIYDCGNGTTGIIAGDIFNKLTDKIDVVPLFEKSDGNFPNHHPDPAVEENLTVLKEKVLELKADVGVSFDGDGDRVGVIDDKGNFITMDKYMIIMWKYLHDKGIEKRTFYDVKCSLALKEELDKLGVSGEFYRTGNSYTKEKSYRDNYPFGGELSGHVFFRDKFNGYDDGIYASLRLIEVLTNQNKSVSELLNGISYYETTPEIKIPVSDDIKFLVVDEIRKYTETKKYNILTIDGVKVLFDDGSALVRASNTGPNLTVRFEAKTKERLTEIKSEFVDKIDEIIRKATIC